MDINRLSLSVRSVIILR